MRQPVRRHKKGALRLLLLSYDFDDLVSVAPIQASNRLVYCLDGEDSQFLAQVNLIDLLTILYTLAASGFDFYDHCTSRWIHTEATAPHNDVADFDHSADGSSVFHAYILHHFVYHVKCFFVVYFRQLCFPVIVHKRERGGRLLYLLSVGNQPTIVRRAAML